MDAFDSAHKAERAPHAGRTVLEVRDLRTYFFTDAGIVRAVDGVSFSVAAGETLGIVGESGSGKSVTALSLMRLLDEPSRIVGGEIRFEGRDVRAMNPEELRALRGDGVAMIFQDPMTSLNPVLRIARQLTETMLAHGKFDQQAATARSVSLLGRMGITAPERAIDCYPHQFSGGMRQRVMLAMGFSNEPALLIADEPTTALDVTIQAQILALIAELNRDFGTAIVLISHDLGVIASVCARVIVMYAGEVVEEGPTELILSDPRHPYTWALINAVPRLDRHVPGRRRLTTIEGAPPDPLVTLPGCRFAARCPFRIARCDTPPALAEIGPGRKTRCWVTQQGVALPLSSGGRAELAATGLGKDPHQGASPQRGPRSASATGCPAGEGANGERETTRSPLPEPLLSVRGLVKHFPLTRNKLLGRPQVVHAVDGVDLDVFPGETVGLVGESGCGKSTFARVVVRIHEPTAGSVRFAGHEIARAAPAAIRALRRRMQMIFQDPYGSLNPRLTVAEAVGEPLRFHGITTTRAATAARINELLVAVGLSPKAGERFPHEFSGGQRQRISIARALAIGPDFIVADEPISALDVNIQAQIINLLVDLQERFRLTYLFIAHDLAVVRHICDRVVVLYLGKVVEVAPADDLFQAPLHPYTRYLISAVPIPDAAVERRRRRLPLGGEPPSAIDPPSGCYFRTRCPHAKPVCAEVPPALAEQARGHFAACHFAGQL
jgi:peptide/nickel transport system ATP-binding protein